MSSLTVALLQLLPGDTLEKQQNIGIHACMQACRKGADLALFPEMWSDGYQVPEDAAALDALAVPADSAFVRSFQALARQLRMAVGITFLEKTSGRPRNSLMLFDRSGREILHYSKVHTCDFEAEKLLASGDGFHTADLPLETGSVRVGAMICFDREFPESARILMLQGAEVILAPNACPMEINRLSTLRARAYENMLAVATCNYPIGQPDCNGRSTVFDGVAWLRGENGTRDMCILEAPEHAGIYLARIDLGLLRRYRQEEVMGSGCRHPEAYGILTRR